MKKKYPDMPMSPEELEKMREKIASMLRTEPESKVRAYLDKEFPRMPKAMQEELLMGMFITTLQEEARELDALSHVQEEGLAASTTLEQMKKDAEAES